MSGRSHDRHADECDDAPPMTDTPFDFDTPPEELSATKAQREAEALRAEIQRHDHLYYVEGAPEISDARYDELYRRLESLEGAHPELVTEDSPTRRIGAAPRSDLPTVEHTAPMLSLDSVQEADGVRRFDERIRAAVDPEAVEYLLEPKLDGVSIELVYESGVLTRAVTRGNGREGEGVTENVRTIPSVPLRLRSSTRAIPGFLAVRGEVFMSLSAFERLNQALVEEGDEPYANPRNATSGAVRQLDSSVTASRPLVCLAYDLLRAPGVSFRTDLDVLGGLQSWGFKVPERVQCVRSAEEILDYHDAYRRDRDSLDYEIDGVVVKLNDLDERVDLGSTSHHPRWALAFKFEPRRELTRIDRIAVQVGRTGALTPVALLLPVEVGGVTVSRATLHNREELERKDIREGDLVRVQRAGDVIPQVVDVIPEEGRNRGKPFEMPGQCPSCDTPVRLSGPLTVCPNRFGCPAQLTGRLIHFGSRNGLDIEGLGAETATLLVGRGLVRELADLFELTSEQLEDLPGFAKKSAQSLVLAIQGRRSTELRRLLFGLGIPEIGVSAAADLATHFRGFEALREANTDALQAVPGIGPKMAGQIRSFLDDPRIDEAVRAVVGKMESLSVPAVERRSGPLAGERFVFTGTLESMSRARAKRLVEEAGAKTTPTVSNETDYLVRGRGGGSKARRAVELDVTILDEPTFLERLEELGIEP